MSAEHDEQERVVRCVATFLDATDDIPEWVPFVQHFDLGFPYAWMSNRGEGTLNKKGYKRVLEAYKGIIKGLDIDPDKKYTDGFDFFQEWQRTH